ncbi:MAG: hypothetical protein AAGJ08_23465 [Cyanobacteria bacterium P01_H01_bin.35]
MISPKLLELEKSIHNLSLDEKLWLLEKIVWQVRQITQEKNSNFTTSQSANIGSNKTDINPIWKIAVEIAKIPQEEWEKLPEDLSKNFYMYQKFITLHPWV